MDGSSRGGGLSGDFVGETDAEIRARGQGGSEGRYCQEREKPELHLPFNSATIPPFVSTRRMISWRLAKVACGTSIEPQPCDRYFH